MLGHSNRHFSIKSIVVKGFCMTMLAWWGIVIIFCMALELSSPGYFFFLSFSVGGLAAGLMAWFELAPVLQGGTFVLVSAITFVLLKNYVQRIERISPLKTNVYALQGKRGIIVEEITHVEKGWVKVEGELWSAVSSDDMPIEKGAVVKVVGNAGSHLTVKKLDNFV